MPFQPSFRGARGHMRALAASDLILAILEGSRHAYLGYCKATGHAPSVDELAHMSACAKAKTYDAYADSLKAAAAQIPAGPPEEGQGHHFYGLIGCAARNGAVDLLRDLIDRGVNAPPPSGLAYALLPSPLVDAVCAPAVPTQPHKPHGNPEKVAVCAAMLLEQLCMSDGRKPVPVSDFKVSSEGRISPGPVRVPSHVRAMMNAPVMGIDDGPLHWAARNRNRPLMLLLESYGATPDVKNAKGLTPEAIFQAASGPEADIDVLAQPSREELKQAALAGPENPRMA